MDFLNALKEVNNYTYTENGAVALKSTGNNVLDAFGTLGSLCKVLYWDSPDYMTNYVKVALDTFYRAFAEDRSLSMKLLFYMRDIRGGQGCRTLFRVIVSSLAKQYPDYVMNNLDNFLFYGRGDDLLCLLDTPIADKVISYIGGVLSEDMASVENGGSCSLLAKWLPSENASSKETKRYAKMIINGLGIKPVIYRKMLSKLRKAIGIVETFMSQNRWEEIDFEKLPSRASMIYSDAFYNHVKEKYEEYIRKIATGDAKINAGALFPVDIIHNILENIYSLSSKDIILSDALWNALPNYFEEAGVEETGLCVVDTSGSMSGTPIEVALSLGIYCADKAKGPFKNHFITFSNNPQLQEIKGNDITEKVRGLYTAYWDMDTNIEKVFNLILKTALDNNLPQDEMPNKLYIISDMQFNSCVYTGKGNGTFMDRMSAKFADNGYTMPAIVYWNVRNSDCGMFQATHKGVNCCMVSGYSPSLFKSVLLGTEYEEVVNEKGEKVQKVKLDPMTIMLNTLNQERYDRVWTGEVV